MSKKILPEVKLQAIGDYIDGLGSFDILGKKYHVSGKTVQKWTKWYNAVGEKAFLRSSHPASYSDEFKKKVVHEYLNGEISLLKLAIKYKVPSEDNIRQWVLKYNGHGEHKTSRKGGYPTMTKGRKTTFNERIEIVKYCISHDHNYAETADKYEVSYQQARCYTVKYETKGIEGLQDRRGKAKSPEEITEVDRLRAEIKILRAEKKQAEMEASFLKKLTEIERRRG